MMNAMGSKVCLVFAACCLCGVNAMPEGEGDSFFISPPPPPPFSQHFSYTTTYHRLPASTAVLDPVKSAAAPVNALLPLPDNKEERALKKDAQGAFKLNGAFPGFGFGGFFFNGPVVASPAAPVPAVRASSASEVKTLDIASQPPQHSFQIRQHFARPLPKQAHPVPQQAHPVPQQAHPVSQQVRPVVKKAQPAPERPFVKPTIPDFRPKDQRVPPPPSPVGSEFSLTQNFQPAEPQPVEKIAFPGLQQRLEQQRPKARRLHRPQGDFLGGNSLENRPRAPFPAPEIRVPARELSGAPFPENRPPFPEARSGFPAEPVPLGYDIPPGFKVYDAVPLE